MLDTASVRLLPAEADIVEADTGEVRGRAPGQHSAPLAHRGQADVEALRRPRDGRGREQPHRVFTVHVTDGGDHLDLVLSAVVDAPGEGNGWPVQDYVMRIDRESFWILPVSGLDSVCLPGVGLNLSV